MQADEGTPYTLYATRSSFYMHYLGSNGSNPKVERRQQYPPDNYMKLSRRTHLIKEISKEEYQKEVGQSSMISLRKFYLLIGTFILDHEPYLLLATKIVQVGCLNKQDIYRITDVQFLPFRSKLFQKQQECYQQSKVVELLKKQYLSCFFYFSYSLNLTNSLAQSIDNQKSDRFNQFAWNKWTMNRFISANVNTCWIFPIIQGYIAEIKKNSPIEFSYLSISRRSIYMCGTRFSCRGLDQQGNASNFVQTQQIFKCGSAKYVHISLRGSAPLFWKQAKAGAQINFSRDKQIEEEQVMKNHYLSLEKQYNSKITTINLLSKEKSPQKQLKNRFETVFKRSMNSKYLYFDLNEEIKDRKNGQASVDNFVKNNFQQIFGDFPFTLIQNLQVSQLQQMYYIFYPVSLALTVLIAQIERMQQWQELASSSCTKSKMTIDKRAEGAKLELGGSFMQEFIEIWTNIGNQISEIYCGTVSVASYMTKKENHSIKAVLGGAIISINRFFNASLSDVLKQHSIDSFLGNHGLSSQTEYFRTNILTQAIDHHEFCSFDKLCVGLLTFCCGGVNIKLQGGQDITSFFSDINLNGVQMFIIHLQQANEPNKWLEIINSYFIAIGFTSYVHYKYEKNNLLSIILIRNESEPHKYQIRQIVEIPLKSYGALAIFIKIDSSLFCFINCKLQSGYMNQYMRQDDLNQIHKCLLSETYKSHLLKMAQAIFIMGNLNFRLSSHKDKDFKFKNLMQQISSSVLISQTSQLIDQALSYDQFPLIKKLRFSEYNEGKINFSPTYKLQAKKAGFDKGRYPAWTDRIIYSHGLKSDFRNAQNVQSIECIEYKSLEQNLSSTHRAVYGKYFITLKKENEQKKALIVQQFFHNQNKYKK